MKNYYSSILCILLVLYASCRPNLTTDFSFLVGSWKMEINDSIYILETWEKVDDRRYSALNYEVSPSGMQLSEEILLEVTDSGTYYNPSIEGIDGTASFSYKFVSQDNDRYVFENDEYTFPSKICYKLIDAKTLEASLENNSGDQKENYQFKKVQ